MMIENMPNFDQSQITSSEIQSDFQYYSILRDAYIQLNFNLINLICSSQQI
ncbi:hypothetical protein pb186bvf_008915 [Paramecium bursaria]